MNNSQNFSHETDSLDMNVTSFESMVNNLSGRIRKMKLRLQFRSEQQKADFELALKRHHDRDEEEI
jgi:thiamine pyrophosphokinase